MRTEDRYGDDGAGRALTVLALGFQIAAGIVAAIRWQDGLALLLMSAAAICWTARLVAGGRKR